jgi:hypothetical protein
MGHYTDIFIPISFLIYTSKEQKIPAGMMIQRLADSDTINRVLQEVTIRDGMDFEGLQSEI